MDVFTIIPFVLVCLAMIGGVIAKLSGYGTMTGAELIAARDRDTLHATMVNSSDTITTLWMNGSLGVNNIVYFDGHN